MTADERTARNRVLALALGWTDIEFHKRWGGDDGEIYPYRWLQGTSPEGHEDAWLPDFYGSLDAVRAALPRDWYMTLVWSERGYGCGIERISPQADEYSPSAFSPNSFAEAAAVALLAWASEHRS